MLIFLDPQSPRWGADLRWIGEQFVAEDRFALLPFHFLHSTLPAIGGRIGLFQQAGERVGLAVLLPRQRTVGASHTYTLRYHHLRGRPQLDPEELDSLAAAHLEHNPFFFYDPSAPRYFAPTHQMIGVVDIGRPTAQEAEEVRRLQGRIWGAALEDLYPADIHSIDFALGTSLVARVEERVVGFLIGFYKFGGPGLPGDWHERLGGDYRLESQIMGVLPDYRGLRIASLLKKVQAEQAWREGIGVINWTADPLQYANAALNFGLLRAVAFDFYPDYYPFRNELNQAPASRFALTWLVGSRRVAETLAFNAKADVLALSRHPHVVRVNDGWRSALWDVDASHIAIEIPADWTAMQQDDLVEAQRWRSATDALFTHYIGREDGRYAITGVGVDGERRYLVGERASDALWARLVL
jgi:predicted GNAT superfamily acetyltransferase